MKANKNFVTADEGVSPVIGVILMVAITVVLAAVVFVLVSDLGSTGDSAPQISFKKDVSGSTATFTVTKVTNGPVTWEELDLSCGSLGSTDTGDVDAGDDFTCAVGDTVKVVHNPTDTLIFGPLTA